MTSSPSPTPSAFAIDGGQVFCSGVADIGLGTQGLGQDAGYSEKQLHNTRMRAYWEDRNQRTVEEKKAEAARLEKLQREHNNNSRRRLIEAQEARAEEIREMGRQRKAHEQVAKQQRQAEAKVRNERIHAEKMEMLERAAAAKEERRVQKERTLNAIRAKRAEMLEQQTVEEEAQEQLTRQHHSQLRHWHEVSKARAAEEAEERRRQREATVRALRDAQKAKEEDHEVVANAVVDLKAQLIREVKQDVTTALTLTLQRRQVELHESAEAVKREEHELQQRRKERIERTRQQRAESAERRRRERQLHREEYRQQQQEHRQALQAEAAKQRSRGATTTDPTPLAGGTRTPASQQPADGRTDYWLSNPVAERRAKVSELASKRTVAKSPGLPSVHSGGAKGSATSSPTKADRR